MAENLSEKTSSKDNNELNLFIICPIGSENSETRIHSDKVKRHIIDPAAVEKNYVTERADQISEPGKITSQIVQRIINDNIVVADITDNNPNVFYELALRHAVGKALILIGKKGEELPFDVSAQRVIFYDLTDPDSVEDSKSELVRQIASVDSGDFIVDSPIGVPISLEDSEIDTSEEILAIVRNTNEQLQNYLGERMRQLERRTSLEMRRRLDMRRKEEQQQNIEELNEQIFQLQSDLAGATKYIDELRGIQELEEEK